LTKKQKSIAPSDQLHTSYFKLGLSKNVAQQNGKLTKCHCPKCPTAYSIIKLRLLKKRGLTKGQVDEMA
jgi:hypothetical protein